MKKINGIVTNIIDQKTIKVQTTSRKKHPLYHKLFTKTKNYLVECQNGKQDITIGSKVIFVNCHPLSKNKKWKLI